MSPVFVAYVLWIFDEHHMGCVFLFLKEGIILFFFVTSETLCLFLAFISLSLKRSGTWLSSVCVCLLSVYFYRTKT